MPHVAPPAPTAHPPRAGGAAPAPLPPPECRCGKCCGYGFARLADEHIYGKPACLQD